MPSLLDAIEVKYGDPDIVGIVAPRISARSLVPKLLILNDCDVESIGEEEALRRTISEGVLEIDLAQNRLTEWTEVSKLLKFTPRVTFLNLSFNNLAAQLAVAEAHSPQLRFPVLPRLTTLILIGTKIGWGTVWTLLRRSPALQEIHLSLNDYEIVEPCTARVEVNQIPVDGVVEGTGEDSGNGSSSEEENDPATFPHIRRLMFDGNPLGGWSEVQKLGQYFPHLKHVGLSDTNIGEIPPGAAESFPNLQSISLANTGLSTYYDIESLAKFPQLREVRVGGIPFLSEIPCGERRQVLIAMMPRVKALNGTPVSTEERENSERAFIRRFAEVENPPQRYTDLVQIHGALNPLVEVRLKPPTRVKITFIWGEVTCTRKVKLSQTVWELKRSLEPLTGLHPSRMRLFYIDAEMQGAFGREEMKYMQKQLYSYKIVDGDEIQVEAKMVNTPKKSKEVNLGQLSLQEPQEGPSNVKNAEKEPGKPEESEKEP